MKIAICDDSSENRMQTKCVATEILGEQCFYEFNSGEAFIASLNNTKYDLVFLDIVMEKSRTGLEIKKMLTHEADSSIIFTTGFSKFMNEAFGNNVIGYITKPVTAEKLKQCIKNAGWRLDDNRSVVLMEGERLLLKNIISIYSKYNYTYAVCTDGKTRCTHASLKWWVKELGEDLFFRINGSRIIAFKYVEGYDNDVLMKNGERIRIAKGKIKEFKRRHIDFIEKYEPII